MNIFIAIDDNGGILFNHRRQSQDKNLREYILQIIGDEKLRMSKYSLTQFKDVNSSRLKVSDNFLEEATISDYCFVENLDFLNFINQVENLYICKWNRAYPSDKKLKLNMGQWILESTIDIQGNSHEKITIEKWRKK